MVMIDKMYLMFMDSIPDYEGKICVPLSGGLDSRVLAGLISKKRKIDLSYCQYELDYPVRIGRNIKSVGYARQIATTLNIPFHSINVNDFTFDDMLAVKGLPMEATLLKSMMYTGLRKLNDIVNLKDYTIIVGHGLDTLTGVHVNPLTLFNYEKFERKDHIKMSEYFLKVFEGTYGDFAKWDCPLWNGELSTFCINLPLKHRFHQRLYRQMIKKYLPELAKIPREGMDVRMDIGEIRYFYERFKYWLKK